MVSSQSGQRGAEVSARLAGGGGGRRAGAGGVGLQRRDAFGERSAAFGNAAGGGGTIDRPRRYRRGSRFGGQDGLDRRIRPFKLHREFCHFGGDVVDALAQQ